MNASSEVRVEYGIGLAVGLGFFPETESAVPEMEQITEDLGSAHTARVALRKPQVKARMQLQYAEYQVDQTIRVFSRMVESAEGGRRGPLFGALLPEGLTAVVAPAGRRQIKPTEALIARVDHCTLPGADALRSEWKPKLQAALKGLTDAAAAFEKASAAYVAAFGKELGLRAEHRRIVQKCAGVVRMAFPGDKLRQDLVFPVLDDLRSGTVEEVEETEGSGEVVNET
jgi:hypothetical protein